MTSLPEELFPEKNDAPVLQHLYSDDIDAETLEFWKRCLMNRCIFLESITFKFADISRDFTVNGLHPSSFSILLEQKKFNDCILPSSDFKESDSVEGGSYAVFSIMWNYLFAAGPSQEDELYVFTPLLDVIEKYVVDYAGSVPEEERCHLYDLSGSNGSLIEFLGAASSGIAKMSDGFGVIYNPMNLLSALVASKRRNHEELQIFLRYMIKKGSAALSPSAQVIKFLGPKELSLQSRSSQWGDIVSQLLGGYVFLSRGRAVGEQDECVARLMGSVRLLERRVEQLETDMDRARDEAKVYMKKGDNHMKMLKMKSFLRSRKDRNTAASTLVTLEGLVQSIRVAGDQKIVLGAYQQAATALRAARSVTDSSGRRVEVTAESVEAAVDAFQEEMTLNAEVGEALQSAADSTGWSVESMDAEELAELEREYAALGEEEEGADGDVKTLTAQIESEFTIGSEEGETKFPVVPTTSAKPVARKTGTASVSRKAEQSLAV